MSRPFRKVPYEPEPNAAVYHEASGYATVKGSSDPAKFAWWYIDYHVGKLTVPQAWEQAPEEIKAL